MVSYGLWRLSAVSYGLWRLTAVFMVCGDALQCLGHQFWSAETHCSQFWSVEMHCNVSGISSGLWRLTAVSSGLWRLAAVSSGLWRLQSVLVCGDCSQFWFVETAVSSGLWRLFTAWMTCSVQQFSCGEVEFAFKCSTRRNCHFWPSFITKVAQNETL